MVRKHNTSSQTKLTYTHTHTGNTILVKRKQRRPTVDGQNLAHPQDALRHRKTGWSNTDHHDPLEHPRIQCCVLADRGGLTCARFCPLKGGSSGPRHTLACARFCPLNRGVTQSCVGSTNINQEWVSGELLILRTAVAPSKPVQDFVHQLSCGRRSKGCPNPTPIVNVGS